MKIFKHILIPVFLYISFLSVPIVSLANTQNKTVDLSKINDQQRLNIIVFLLKNQEPEKAVHAILHHPFENVMHIIDSQIMLADALFMLGKKQDSIAILRKLLDAQPNIDVARFKLAQMLFTVKNDTAAKHHFELLFTEKQDPQSKQVIIQYLNNIAHRKAWFFNVGGSYAPQSNFNGGLTKAKYFCNDYGADSNQINFWRSYFNFIGQDCDAGIIPTAAQMPKSGMVLNLNGLAGYRFKINPNASWTVKATGNLTRYPHTLPAAITLALNTGPSLTIGNQTKLTLDAGASISISERKVTSNYFSVSAEIDHAFSPTISSNSLLTISKGKNHIDADLGHLSVSLQNYLRISINNSSFIKLMAGVSAGRYIHPNNSYKEANFGVGLYKEFGLGITIYAEATYARRHKTLEDINNFNFSAKLTKRDFNIWGFAPELIYSYQNYDSTRNLFDKSGHSIKLGITKAF